jgi:hypothetical protein
MQANNTFYIKKLKRVGWWRMKVFMNRELRIFDAPLIKIWLSTYVILVAF